MKNLIRIIDGIILLFAACSVILTLYAGNIFKGQFPYFLFFFIVNIAAVIVNVIPSPFNFKIKPTRLRMLADGSDLIIAFLVSSVISIAFHIYLPFTGILSSWLGIGFYIASVLNMLLILFVTFINAVIRVCIGSSQIGVGRKVAIVLTGGIPVVNFFTLIPAIKRAKAEVNFESEKTSLDLSRAKDEVCKTKYPILLVHGVFFRDFKYFNYWGRITDELQKNGAKVYFGNHQSALSVIDSAKELTARIKQITAETGCEKVNIIAHSKGGIDCRCAISNYGADKYVASLTTINTPHRGCEFADYLLGVVPKSIQDKIANTYNATMRKFGDENPDFLAAVADLTHKNCEKLNETTPDVDGVFYQSVGSKLNKASNGQFPLNFSYHLVKYFNGANDGLVAESSFKWGSKYTFVTTEGKRGISHGDMIDLNRENIDGFDVREFYVQLVGNLKSMGL
ncbi:MAG: esterase/lipase family protein [Ruminococcus sp.]